MEVRLYPVVVRRGTDFTKCPVVTVPMQSMTLKEIIRRFIRREPLPLAKEGFYAENHGDLEKMLHKDLTVIHEQIEQLKLKVASGKASIEAADAAAKTSVSPAASAAAPAASAAAPAASAAPPVVVS